jgi:hypothetical protein
MSTYPSSYDRIQFVEKKFDVGDMVRYTGLDKKFNKYDTEITSMEPVFRLHKKDKIPLKDVYIDAIIKLYPDGQRYTIKNNNNYHKEVGASELIKVTGGRRRTKRSKSHRRRRSSKRVRKTRR